MTVPFAAVPVISRHAVGGAMVRKGRGTVTPPAAPGTLTATAGDAQVALSWVASATSGVTYQVKRVNAGAVVWSGSATSTTITGLNNAVTYNFQVYAVNGAGTSSPSNIATAVPQAVGSPTPVTTLFGYNWNNKDTANQTIAGRKAWFTNRVPMVRVYGTAGQVGSFDVSTSVAVEKRVCWTFKAGGSFTATQLSNGTATPTMKSWLESIPAGWTVVWGYHHEPNSGTTMEVDPTLFRNTYHQMRLALNSATLAAGTQVFIACNFMAYQTATIKANMNSWIPPRADCDWLTWDIYGNPGVNTSASGSNKYGTATGSGYGSTYPIPSQRTADMWTITEAMGYAENWGILEINSPARSWDTGEVGRVAWHNDMLSIIQAPPMTGAVPPKICLLWEAPSGANWDQAYGRVSNNPTPMVNVWKPYITSVPVGG